MKAAAALLLLAGVCAVSAPALRRSWPAPAGGSDGSARRLATTDPGISLRNLDGAIRSSEQAEWTPERQARLVELLLTRGRFLGRVADYERAQAIAEELVRRSPAAPPALLARASVRATFHRFQEALADLDRAERLGAAGEAAASLRAGILAATGRRAEALAIRRRLAAERPGLVTLAGEALALGAAGDHDAAQQGFARALARPADASPFPVAWLHFERGRLALRAGRPEAAREAFLSARAALPQYAAATTHLGEVEAALGRTERAVALLSEAARRSDDPDAAGQLARVLAEAGRLEEAAEWSRRAQRRYRELLARHPDAFAEHAAEFWLGAGDDPARALELALRNARLRRTPEACELLARAAAAAAVPPPRCAPVA